METQYLTLAVGESHEIRLASRGASGLQLLFALDLPEVVSVTRREATAAELATPHPNVGGAVPAFFMLRGLKPGQARVDFFERPPGRSAPDIPAAAYQLTVVDK